MSRRCPDILSEMIHPALISSLARPPDRPPFLSWEWIPLRSQFPLVKIDVSLACEQQGWSAKILCLYSCTSQFLWFPEISKRDFGGGVIWLRLCDWRCTDSGVYLVGSWRGLNSFGDGKRDYVRPPMMSGYVEAGVYSSSSWREIEVIIYYPITRYFVKCTPFSISTLSSNSQGKLGVIRPIEWPSYFKPWKYIRTPLFQPTSPFAIIPPVFGEELKEVE